jgi:hypothetical protein
MTRPCASIAPATARAAVETLVLPRPGVPPAECPGCVQPLGPERNILRSGGTKAGGPALLSPPREGTELIRYRWAVGHQAAFALWQLLTLRLTDVLRATCPSPQQVESAALGYDVYSVLFLYTGSCSATQYGATARQDMTSCHPAFSGEWAPDHEGIPRLLQEIRNAHPGVLTAPLNRAVRLNQRIHMAVAEHLVPQGASLLQNSGRHPGTGPTSAERTLYDTFFRVLRAPVCRHLFRAQLLRRLAQIVRDLSTHGLHPRGVGMPSLPGPHREGADRLCRDATPLLAEFARSLQTEYSRPLLQGAT